jgi:hypothetical protein
MNSLIDRIAQIATLAIPKSLHDRNRVISAFGGICGESEQSWFVSCSHLLNTPANARQITETEKQLGYSIPEEYKQFLTVSNGAKLFITPRNRSQGGPPHVRYHLFSCDELVRVNQVLLQTFLAAYASDDEFKEVRSLNYMAYCDAADDNYQAMVIEGVHRNRIFLLFYEFQCRPYSELDSEFYYTISESLGSWFELLLRSAGWEGRGEQTGGL